MRVAVVGGGINGVMAAWRLREHGHTVELFERDTLMSATSSASSKLLHGGLRYLEQGDVRLVREGLRERAWWLANAPDLCHPIELVLPVYRDSPHGRLALAAALAAYNLLAGRATLGRHQWHSARHLPRAATGLRPDGLRGVFTYVDAQMTDDAALGLWAADRARDAGVRIHEHAPVRWISPNGELDVAGDVHHFDAIANVTGPWARALLDASGIPTRTRLDLVRGSHLVVDRALVSGFALQLPLDGRLVFALPYQGRTLVGTTEVRQPLDAPIHCSVAERDYLLGAYNAFFRDPITAQDVRSTFAGLRPLVHRGRSAHVQRRGERIERTERVITVFGGKWTGSRALGERVARSVDRIRS